MGRQMHSQEDCWLAVSNGKTLVKGNRFYKFISGSLHSMDLNKEKSWKLSANDFCTYRDYKVSDVLVEQWVDLVVVGDYEIN